MRTESTQSLCSQRDPQKEASQWVDLQKASEQHSWILGLGEGHHVAAFARKFQNRVISVVDHRPELETRFRKNFPDMKNQVRVEIVSLEEELLSSKSFSLFGSSLSSVHIFRPALQSHLEMYQLFSKSLRGQTHKSFAVFTEIFGMSFTATALLELKEFHIKEIAALIPSKKEDDSSQWIRVLRELVA